MANKELRRSVRQRDISCEVEQCQDEIIVMAASGFKHFHQIVFEGITLRST
jgi:hypothetical protein